MSDLAHYRSDARDGGGHAGPPRAALPAAAGGARPAARAARGGAARQLVPPPGGRRPRRPRSSRGSRSSRARRWRTSSRLAGGRSPDDTAGAAVGPAATGSSARPRTTRSASCASAGRGCSPRRIPAERSGELPRRLGKDEKWLFDLGQELRAAADTNRAEGVFRKPQIDVTPGRHGSHPGHGALPRSTARSAGFVQHERPLEAVAAARAPLPLLLLVVLPLAALWLAALALNRAGGVRGRRRALDPVPRGTRASSRRPGTCTRAVRWPGSTGSPPTARPRWPRPTRNCARGWRRRRGPERGRRQSLGRRRVPAAARPARGTTAAPSPRPRAGGPRRRQDAVRPGDVGQLGARGGDPGVLRARRWPASCARR